ncbi:MAG TPA: hypothetical protein VL404_10150, partial [Candidatus Eisenbacteria bacterium]|nr:hypothetical protein [Candidatus Eisenbacteria bacterium]
ADHVVKNLTAPPSAAKPLDRSSVLLTWGPPAARTPPGNSQELKHYLARRGERKPNAVPVIIVIRPGNG